MTISTTRQIALLREELTSVLVALWYEIDHHQGAIASQYFTADAKLCFEDATFRGTAAIDAVYRQRAARGPRVSRHVVANLHLVEVEKARVRAVSTLLLFAEDGEAPRPKTSPALVADVWDVLELSGDRWLISSRWINNKFIASPDDLAVPTK